MMPTTSMCADGPWIRCAWTRLPALILIAAACTGRLGAGEPPASWSSFLVFDAAAIDAERLPLRWTPEDLTWKADVRGYGQSSPVLWQDRLFVTSVQGPMKDVYHVSCFDATSGQQQWIHSFDSSWPSESSTRVSRAAPTPVVDHQGIYVFFESGDLVCLDHDGQPRWARSLQDQWGEFVNRFGISASPLQTATSVIVLVDHEAQSRLAAFDKQSGRQQWGVDRGKRSRTWASPGLIDVDGVEIVVCSSSGSVDGYLAEDGSELFSISDVGGNTAATPIDLGGGEFLVSSLIRPADGPSEQATRSNRKLRVWREGDRWQAESCWTAESARGGFCSPVGDAECCYWLNPVGVLFCLDRQDGQQHYAQRLSCGSCWATPLAIGDRLYAFGRDGTTIVARTGTNFELLAEGNRVWPEDEPGPSPDESGQPPVAADDPIQPQPTLYSVLAIDGALIFRRGDAIYRVDHR